MNASAPARNVSRVGGTRPVVPNYGSPARFAQPAAQTSAYSYVQSLGGNRAYGVPGAVRRAPLRR